MNYENMSDFEINKAVSMVVDFGDLVCFVNDEREAVYICEVDGAYSMNPVGGFDPCNNPADAWTIILENKISIMNSDEAWEASIDFNGDLNKHGTDEVLTKHIEDENPLRAAMIVFLMMNKGE